MKYDPQKHHRRSIRLKGYDYTQPGAYFVTICTQDRTCLFGEVVNGQMQLNEAGRRVVTEWETLPERFPCIQLDAFVVMPNHVHGIVWIQPVGAQFIAPHGGVMNHAPTASPHGGVMNHAPTAPHGGVMNHAPTLGQIIRVFKAVTTRAIRQMIFPQFAWQRNYYEHIIRNEDSLNRIRRYIANNPAQWTFDRENPNRATLT
ncbi:MAG: transposase [Desulfosoma sp.]